MQTHQTHIFVFPTLLPQQPSSPPPPSQCKLPFFEHHPTHTHAHTHTRKGCPASASDCVHRSSLLRLIDADIRSIARAPDSCVLGCLAMLRRYYYSACARRQTPCDAHTRALLSLSLYVQLTKREPSHTRMEVSSGREALNACLLLTALVACTRGRQREQAEDVTG